MGGELVINPECGTKRNGDGFHKQFAETLAYDLCKRLAFSELKTPTSAKIVFHFDVHPSSMQELQNESGPNIQNQG